MCGIIGIALLRLGAIGKPLGIVIYECLKRLEYRGYDSVGYAVLTDQGLVVRKSKGKIDDVFNKLEFRNIDGVVGIGHTRWATHGIPSDVNAHPHTDCNNRIAVVHNGIIENYLELRRYLESRGHVFKSETDTEVIPHMIEELKKRGFDTYTAFKITISMLRGTYAIAVIDLDNPDKIFFARKTSPLVLGLSDRALFVSSDIPAFLPYTNKIIVVQDDEVGYVSTDGAIVIEKLSLDEKHVSEIDIENIDMGIHSSIAIPSYTVDIKSRIKVIDWSPELVDRGGYPHFMLKEIFEQPYALAQTLAGLEGQIEKAIDILRRADKVIVIGAGSSYHSSYIGSLALIELAGIWSRALISSEARWFFNRLTDRDVVIAVSQSGETIDTLVAVREAKKVGAKVIAISNVLESAIPRESDYAIYTRAGPEIGVAATKTFTTQVLTLTYLALSIGRKTGTIDIDKYYSIKDDLRKIPEIAKVVIEKYNGLAQDLANKLYIKNSAYYLGRGTGLGVAMEGALKMKEIAYVHAEAYPAGESKHGPIALVERDFPVVFIALNEEEYSLITSNIEEMKAREAFIITVVSLDIDRVPKSDITIGVPSMNKYAASIPTTIPLQLIAYYTAVKKGYDPDKPRNLAKTVTVI